MIWNVHLFMSVWEAFLAHSDRDFVCKWAIEFGDRKLLLMLFENRPKELIESAIDLGVIPYMVNLADSMGIGRDEFQSHMLNRGTLSDLSKWMRSKSADKRMILDRMREIAASDVSLALAEFSRSPSLELEDAVIRTGDVESIRSIARHPLCDLARKTLAEMKSVSEVMES